jgi:hypothetical protein
MRTFDSLVSGLWMVAYGTIALGMALLLAFGVQEAVLALR